MMATIVPPARPSGPLDQFLYWEDLPAQESALSGALYNAAESLLRFSRLLESELPIGYIIAGEDDCSFADELQHRTDEIEKAQRRIWSYPKLTPAHADSFRAKFDALMEFAEGYREKFDGFKKQARQRSQELVQACRTTLGVDCDALQAEVDRQSPGGRASHGIFTLRLFGQKPATLEEFANDYRAIWADCEHRERHLRADFHKHVMDLVDSAIDLNNMVVMPFKPGASERPEKPAGGDDAKAIRRLLGSLVRVDNNPSNLFAVYLKQWRNEADVSSAKAWAESLLLVVNDAKTASAGIARHVDGLILQASIWETNLRTNLRLLGEMLATLPESLHSAGNERAIIGLAGELYAQGTQLQDAHETCSHAGQLASTGWNPDDIARAADETIKHLIIWLDGAPRSEIDSHELFQLIHRATPRLQAYGEACGVPGSTSLGVFSTKQNPWANTYDAEFAALRAIRQHALRMSARVAVISEQTEIAPADATAPKQPPTTVEPLLADGGFWQITLTQVLRASGREINLTHNEVEWMKACAAGTTTRKTIEKAIWSGNAPTPEAYTQAGKRLVKKLANVGLEMHTKGSAVSICRVQE